VTNADNESKEVSQEDKKESREPKNQDSRNRETTRRTVLDLAMIGVTKQKKVNDKYKTGEGYHAVPPPYTGNFIPPKPDLVLANKDEYVFSKLVTSVPSVATSEVKTSESRPKSVSEPLIED
ncbi:hypothetical protein Tco_0336533, partial [Tanacetum coccineum]